MFFDNLNEIKPIASKTGTSIFVVPDKAEVSIDDAIMVQPDEKASITIEQVREMIRRVELRQTNDVYIVIRPAEKLSQEAANAFLKNLEEPGEKVHFILVTSAPGLLLPTILSRGAIYIYRGESPMKAGIDASEEVKGLAKRLLAVKPDEMVALAEEITKHKDGVRAYALSVIGVAIEMLYKTYLLNDKYVFLQKLPRFLAMYDAVERNGSVKLQIVANLI